MFSNYSFAEILAFVPSDVMRTFAVIMFILVVAGTLFDVIQRSPE